MTSTPPFAVKLALVFAGLLTAVSTLMATSSGRRNVLVFFVDDLRPELGCYGTDYIQTPHIDQLAQQGVLFERAYCQQALCAPSRISMMSGQYPDTTGIHDLFTPLRRKIPDVMTLPRYFQARGFVTASYGKVYHHHDDDKAYWSDLPESPGDIYADPQTLADMQQRTEDAKRKGLKDLELWAATRGPAVEAFEVEDDGYRDGAVAQQAIASLRHYQDQPFFMCVGFAKPHLPFSAPQRYWDLYQRDQFDVPDRDLPAGTPTLAVTKWGELRGYYGVPAEGDLSDEQTKALRHGYAACVSYTDAQVGKVLAELDRLGLRENTIVVLWGDHGYKLGDYGLWCKHTNLELDTRVPLIVSAPGHAAGKRSESLVEIVDLFPTLAALTGGDIPDSCEGQNLVPLLHDPSQSLRPFALSQYPRGKVMGYSLRDERWRYTEWVDSRSGAIVERELNDHQDSSWAEGNLAADPNQAERVAAFSHQLKIRRERASH